MGSACFASEPVFEPQKRRSTPARKARPGSAPWHVSSIPPLSTGLALSGSALGESCDSLENTGKIQSSRTRAPGRGDIPQVERALGKQVCGACRSRGRTLRCVGNVLLCPARGRRYLTPPPALQKGGLQQEGFVIVPWLLPHCSPYPAWVGSLLPAPPPCHLSSAPFQVPDFHLCVSETQLKRTHAHMCNAHGPERPRARSPPGAHTA